jgi:subtilisin family serine protease
VTARVVACAALLALLSVGGANGAASSAKLDPALAAVLARGGTAKVIVDVSTPAGAQKLRADGFRATARWAAVAAVPGVASAAGVGRLAADPAVVRVGLDLGGHGGGAPDLSLIHADVAHGQGLTGRGVNVAVLDSGVDETHPDLRSSIVAEHCFGTTVCRGGARELGGPGSAADDNGHGTNVAGIVTSDGTRAPIGVAPGAGLVAVKVLDAQNRFDSTSDIVSALNWVATARPDVRVVNMSLGTDRPYAGRCDTADASTRALASVVATLRARGTLVFASSMNNRSTTTMAAPACIAGVVSVGAVYARRVPSFFVFGCSDPAPAADRVACFSDSDSALDLLGPGALVVSTGRGGGVSTYTGTSQASPHAAGAAALLLEAEPSLSAGALERLLKATGRPVTDPRNGMIVPRIDVAAALDSLHGRSASATVAPRTLRFGRVRIGRSRTLRVTVRSTGPVRLSVAAGRAPAGFAVRPGTLDLAPGASGSLRVTFRPRAARSSSGRLTLGTNAPAADRVVVRLTGVGAR